MGLPANRLPRLFYRAATQRYEDAELLLANDRTTGAVYLAGYGVECMMKALLLSATTENKQSKLIVEFRGRQAHDFEWLQGQYVRRTGRRFPVAITRHLTRVRTWTTDIRYAPGTIRRNEADAFLRSAATIIEWIDGRL